MAAAAATRVKGVSGAAAAGAYVYVYIYTYYTSVFFERVFIHAYSYLRKKFGAKLGES